MVTLAADGQCNCVCMLYVLGDLSCCGNHIDRYQFDGGGTRYTDVDIMDGLGEGLDRLLDHISLAVLVQPWKLS